MNEVIPDIFCLPLPMPNPALSHINAYLIRGASECLLIDTGWNTNEAFDSMKEQLGEIGVGIEDITQILATHIHADHYALAGRLKQLSQAKILLHQLEKNVIDSRYVNMDGLLEQVSQWLGINGAPENELSHLGGASTGMRGFVAPVLPDVTLQGGETIAIDGFTFKVMWTPGHSPGHIVLYEPQRKILISGDHILPGITPNIGLHPQSSSANPLADYINSLHALEDLEVSLILPGHEQVFTGLKERVGQIIEHHGERNSEILAALNTQPKTAYQVAANEITWMPDAGGVAWDDLGWWARRSAMLETLSHLEAMRADGKLVKSIKDDIIYYRSI